MARFAKFLILSAVLLAGFALWRGFFYYPNEEDAGLTARVAEAASAAAGNVSGAKSPAPASATTGSPARLLIPKLGVDAKIQAMGLTKKGNMAAPSNYTDVSWYKLGAAPGVRGSAVMAGHVDNAAGLAGVFKHLDDLSVGDDVYVTDKNGTKLHFRVTAKKVYPYNLSGAELKKVFAASDAAHLNLITCTGEWVEALKTNDKRLVVFTELVTDLTVR
jgi:LPXTG-site transpeptidase (sortase) family protein